MKKLLLIASLLITFISQKSFSNPDLNKYAFACFRDQQKMEDALDSKFECQFYECNGYKDQVFLAKIRAAQESIRLYKSFVANENEKKYMDDVIQYLNDLYDDASVAKPLTIDNLSGIELGNAESRLTMLKQRNKMSIESLRSSLGLLIGICSEKIQGLYKENREARKAYNLPVNNKRMTPVFAKLAHLYAVVDCTCFDCTDFAAAKICQHCKLMKCKYILRKQRQLEVGAARRQAAEAQNVAPAAPAHPTGNDDDDGDAAADKGKSGFPPMNINYNYADEGDAERAQKQVEEAASAQESKRYYEETERKRKEQQEADDAEQAAYTAFRDREDSENCDILRGELRALLQQAADVDPGYRFHADKRRSAEAVCNESYVSVANTWPGHRLIDRLGHYKQELTSLLPTIRQLVAGVVPKNNRVFAFN